MLVSAVEVGWGGVDGVQPQHPANATPWHKLHVLTPGQTPGMLCCAVPQVEYDHSALHTLSKAPIVGITTSGLAKNQGLIAAIRPRVGC